MTIRSFSGEYAFLSNFLWEPMVYEGVTYSTVEHAFQAAKTEHEIERELIRLAATPSRAKRLGRTVTLRSDWNTIRISIMRELLRIKFQSPALRERLLKTGQAELVEGNTWHDNFWGECSCSR